MKLAKKLLCALMVLTMTLVGPMSVFAEGYAYDRADSDPSSTVEKMVPTVLTTGSKAEMKKVKSYGIDVSCQPDSQSAVIPVEIKKDGILDFGFYSFNNNSTGSVTIGFCKDQEGTQVLEKDSFYMNDTATKSYQVGVKKGTYYLIILCDELTALENFKFGFDGYIYALGDKTLKNKTNVVSASNGKATYYKYTVSKPSLVYFDFVGGNKLSGEVTLCNSSKKAISATKTYQYAASQAYAVSKGTYYFKVVTNNSVYQVQAEAKSVNDTAGSTASKAKALKLKTATKGLITTNDKKGKSDFYKFTTSKSGQIPGFYIAYSGQGSIKITVKAPGCKAVTETIPAGQYVYYSSFYETRTSSSGTSYRDIKAPKGTYTVQIQKTDSKSNGVYEVGTKAYK